MRYGENMKNLVKNKNQLNLFNNLNEVVEENITTDDILDFIFGNNRKGNK